MQTPRLFIGILGLGLILIAPAFAQTGKFAVGLDYGTTMLQRAQPVFFSPFLYSSLFPGDAIIPQNIRAHVDLNVSSSFALRLSAGYGMTKHQNSFSGTAGSARLRSEATVKASGFPLEGAMIFQLPLDGTRRFGVHFGVGGGFYSYKFKAEGFEEISGSSIASENRRNNFTIPAVKLSGPAQFFLLGFDLRLSSKIRTTLELSKLGWSGMKEKQEDHYMYPISGNVSESQQDHYNADSGFNDIGLSFGMSLNLGK